MKAILKLIALFVFCIWPPESFAAETLYLWSDDEDKLHISRAVPAEGSRIIDIMEYEPRPSDDGASGAKPTETRKRDPLIEEKCRLVALARRIARDARDIADAADDRADKKREQSDDLKKRVGYDDELIDDYKDDIRELEDAARQAELFARQAGVQAREAALQARRAELEAGSDCRF